VDETATVQAGPGVGGNAPVEKEPTPLRKVHHLDPKKAFGATAQMDRWKEYIKDIPVLRARIIKAVEHLEALVSQLPQQLEAAHAAQKAFDEATVEITSRFQQWEKTHESERSATAGEAGTPAGGQPIGSVS
jgi:hypothetical protein